MEEKNNQNFYDCLKKQSQLKKEFTLCASKEMRYQKIIDLGKELPPISPENQTPENCVKGCQSLVYLHSYMKDGKIWFEAASEALISAGLASLLIKIYTGQSPETVLKCPPLFIEELQIHASLTPGRSNGLSSIYLRMKQDALKFLLPSNYSSSSL